MCHINNSSDTYHIHRSLQLLAELLVLKQVSLCSPVIRVWRRCRVDCVASSSDADMTCLTIHCHVRETVWFSTFSAACWYPLSLWKKDRIRNIYFLITSAKTAITTAASTTTPSTAATYLEPILSKYIKVLKTLCSCICIYSTQLHAGHTQDI